MESFTENSNNDSRATDDNGELDKLKKNYLLLKRKICRTHELIRQYNDKVKECERINQELESTQTELKTLKTTYNGVLGKVIKLEYQNKQYEKQITSMSSTTETQEIQIAGNKQHLHQLSCKLKETVDKCADDQMQWEIEKSLLQEKIKEMERKLKINKNSNSVIKNINKSRRIDKGTNCNFQNLISKVNVAVNTINDSTITRADKDVMTNLSFGNKKNDFYPLFCDKCGDYFSDPAKAICKAMTKHYELIEPISPCRELEEDWENDERSNFQNPSKDQNKSSNSTFKLSRISSALREDQIPNVVREEISVNSTNTSTETLTHTMDDLKNQMKRLEKKIKRQSYQNWPPNYNYFQVPPPFSNFHNQMCICSINKSTSRYVNHEYNVNKTSRRSKKIQKRKHRSKVRKLNLKKTKCKRVKKIVSASNVVWKVDSIVPCYKQIIRTDKSTSNNHLYRLPSRINNDLMLDNGSSFTNVEKDICRNNLIETANGNNISKLNISSDKPCLSSTIIEEIQPVRDTRSILEPLNIKSNTSVQYETNIVTDKDTINNLDSTRNRASILSTDTSMSNNSNVFNTKKQTNIPLTEESNNTENMIEDKSNPIDEVPIHVNTSDSISNITENNTISKNRKRKLQIFENKLKKLNLNENLLISKKINNSIHNIKSNVMNIIETKSENISEKNINNKSNVQTVNTDVVLKKKQRIIHEEETNNQEVSTFSNENINVIKKMDDESVEVAQANILDCTSLNKKETECIEEKSNNIEVSNKQHRFNINRNPKSKYVCTLNKNRIRILRNIKKLQARPRLYKVGNLKLLDSDEPINTEDESVAQKKCVSKLKYNKNNIVEINLMKKINKLKVIDSELIEEFSENTCNNETQIKLTGKSETLMENVQIPAASSIAISTDINESTKDECFTDINESIKDECFTDINESTKDECFTDTMTPLKDSKLMQNEDALININENAERENIESCNGLISDEENKMIKNANLDYSKFELVSPLKKKHISKDMCEKSLENEINEPIQNVKIESQILNMNEIDTSIHSERNIESQVTGLETSTFVEEETTAEIFNKNMKETKELNIESNKICPDKQGNLIIKTEKPHNSTITTKEKSNELTKDTSINNTKFELISPLKVNQISNDTCASSTENKLLSVSTNISRIPQQVLKVALVNSKLRKTEKLFLPKQNKEMNLNKIGKNVSIKNIKVREKLSKISKNIRKCDNLNNQSCNATVNSSQYVSANSRVNNKHADNDHLNSLVNPIVLLENYLQQNLHHGGWKKSIQERKKKESLHKKIDKFVYEQLSKIVDNTDWGMSVHRDVVEKLSSTCGARIIANGIVNFMFIQKKDNIDKTYTPPAPTMTAAQQKIVALLVDLEMKVPTVIKWVQDGIEYKIFRLNCKPTFCQIENLIRLYIALTRIQKDREKLRMLCCDALYCLGISAASVIYITLTCWPEVLPKFTENNDMLSKCIVHCIMCLQANDYPQLKNLKNYLSIYYNYKKGSYLTKNLVEELLRSFERSNSKENIECLRTAVILLAKKEGVSWTHTNIIKNILLPNIVDRKYAYVQEVFALLGNLMRTFPLEDKNGIVKNTIEQLTDLLDSGEGLHEQQEGIASALLSLSRHDLTKVINCVMKWIPKEPLKSTTMDQYSALFSLRTKAYWKKYLGSVKKVVTQIESKDTPHHNVCNENK